MGNGYSSVRDKEWSPNALKDYQRFQKTDRATAAKIDELLADIEKTPFTGLGKPEWLPLRGCWSRRIHKKDRLMYDVTDDTIYIYSCREHYDDH